MFKHFLLYKVYYFISALIEYIKSKHYIKDTFYSKEFKFVLDKYLNTNVSKDWLGRLYCVVNPNIDKNGDFNVSNMIIELDGDNTNNHEHIKQWTFKQMKLIAYLFKIEKLYNYINIDFTHVGPENMDNYLLVFDIVSRKEMAQSFKKMSIHLLIYIIIALILIFTFII